MVLSIMTKKHSPCSSAPPDGLAAMRPNLVTRQRVTISTSKNRLNALESEMLARRLEALPGVYSVYIGLQTEMAHIVYDPKTVDLRSLRLLINDLG